MNIPEWLRDLGLDEYASAFRDNHIDPQLLLRLTARDLKEIGVASVGHRRKIVDAIGELRKQAVHSAHPAMAPSELGNAPVGAPEPEVERRQLTVMFCDLVGSTALASRLELEDLRDLIGAYHRCVSDTVQGLGGFVAKYMGDGVLVYFGYPQAHDDDAEQAVRAGLELIEAVGRLELPSRLQIRIGIATGIVVVGDILGSGEARERGVVGETPNLAARLQSLAEPDSVVIGQKTHHLLGRLFDFRDLGGHAVKGFSDPIRAYQVLRPSSIASRFAALHGDHPTYLVGRDEELETLLRRWQRSRDAEGQVILLSGEPGIGKSRIAVAIMEKISAEQHTRLCYFCSPHHTDSAYYPIICQLEQAATLNHYNDATAKLDKLDALLLSTSTAVEDRSLIADLLSLPMDGRFPALELSPQQRKSRTLEALIRQLEVLACREPILMVFEDVHWIDPTTMELLDRIVDRVRTLPVLVVVTFRPEFTHPWARHPHVSEMMLDRLGPHDGIALVKRILGKRSLTAHAVRQIVERTDGIPLFLEELTKAVVESSADGDGTFPTASSSDSAIPATLHDSLMARLDRLGPAKQVAQIGAVIGREFSFELLASVSERYSPSELRASLDQLIASGLLLRRGTEADIFLFKHALVQDAAYSTLLRRPRQQLHDKIARALEAHFPDRAAREPEVLAHHLSEASEPLRASEYWLTAGAQAARRSANVEAIAHFSRGLNELKSLPSGPDKDRRELALQTAIGTPLISVHGYAAAQTGAAYSRARALCHQYGDSLSLHAMLSGEFVYHFVRGDYEVMRQLAAEAGRSAERTGDEALLLAGHRMAGMAAMHFGSLATARSEFETILRLYDPGRHRLPPVLYIHDPKISALSYLPIIDWILGYPDRARSIAAEAFRYAGELNQANLTAHVRTFAGAGLQELLGEVSAVAEHADAMISLADQHSLGYWRLNGLFLRGWVSATSGDLPQGIALMRESLNGRAAMGVSWHQIRYLCMLSATLQNPDAAETGLRVIAEARELVAGHEEHLWEAELQRIEAELLAFCGSAAERESGYLAALATARRQAAKSLELRAAVGLTRLWTHQSRSGECRELLGPLCASFTEGFETSDVRQATQLLGALHT